MKRRLKTQWPLTKMLPAAWLVASGACVTNLTIGEGLGVDGGVPGSGGSPSSGGSNAGGSTGDARVDTGPKNCGGEAAAGGYSKFGAPWDGMAGNPYGYPAEYDPAQDCSGFGFHDTCNFWELCDISCRQSSECPTVPGGPLAQCRPQAFSPTPGAPTSCVLPCADGSACPNSMQCVFHPYGFGEICMWRATFGAGGGAGGGGPGGAAGSGGSGTAGRGGSAGSGGSAGMAGGGTGGFGGGCAPLPDDSECIRCARTNCCGELLACGQEAVCGRAGSGEFPCVVTCVRNVVADGGVASDQTFQQCAAVCAGGATIALSTNDLLACLITGERSDAALGPDCLPSCFAN